MKKGKTMTHRLLARNRATMGTAQLVFHKFTTCSMHLLHLICHTSDCNARAHCGQAGAQPAGGGDVGEEGEDDDAQVACQEQGHHGRPHRLQGRQQPPPLPVLGRDLEGGGQLL